MIGNRPAWLRTQQRFFRWWVLLPVIGFFIVSGLSQDRPELLTPSQIDKLAEIQLYAAVRSLNNQLQRPPGITDSADANANRASDLIRQINRSAEAISSLGFGKSPPDIEEMQRAYLKSAMSVKKVVEQTRKLQHPTDKDLARLQDAVRDMKLKEQSPLRGLDLVNVHARPILNGAEQAGYQVWWAYFGDADDPAAYIKMAGDSTRAYANLTPGLYCMYTQKASWRGSVTKVSVDASKTERDIDLPLPQ